jgi:hypothetical protein
MPLEFTDELLSAYLDGELTPAERVQVEARLASDPHVRQLLDELRVLSGEVRALPRYSVGAGFSQRVIAAAMTARGKAPPSQSGEVMPATRAGTPSSPDKVRRGRRLPVVLAGVAAVAAAVAVLVWFANRPPVGPGPDRIVQGDSSSDQPITNRGHGTQGGGDAVGDPRDAAAAQIALARLRQAIPQEGDGLVLRLKLAPGQPVHEALDEALAAAGLGTRTAEDESTGAHSVARAYQDKLAEKLAGQPGQATVAAADAVFVTAPLDQLEVAIAALAARPQPLEIEPLMSGKVVFEADLEGEGPGTGPAKPKHFAQRLPAEQFRLEQIAAPLAEIMPPAEPRDPARPVRVLILVESQ